MPPNQPLLSTGVESTSSERSMELDASCDARGSATIAGAARRAAGDRRRAGATTRRAGAVKAWLAATRASARRAMGTSVGAARVREPTQSATAVASSITPKPRWSQSPGQPALCRPLCADRSRAAISLVLARILVRLGPRYVVRARRGLAARPQTLASALVRSPRRRTSPNLAAARQRCPRAKPIDSAFVPSVYTQPPPAHIRRARSPGLA